MKKIQLFLFAATLLLMSVGVSAFANAPDNSKIRPGISKDVETAEVNALIARVNEINAMDKTTLTSTERVALRKELRALKKEANERSGGVVYISVGLILLIILLILII